MPDFECYVIGIGGHGMTNTTFNIAYPTDVLLVKQPKKTLMF
jgi:hypothetical protein